MKPYNLKFHMPSADYEVYFNVKLSREKTLADLKLLTVIRIWGEATPRVQNGMN